MLTRVVLSFIILACHMLDVKAQTTELRQTEDGTLLMNGDTLQVDASSVWPEYKGGNTQMNRFLGANIRYPRDAKRKGIKGRVTIGFTVSKSGSIKDTYIDKGVYPSLDKEALRVVELMPAWKPGVNDGVPVDVKYKVDIVFNIPN